MYKDWIVNSFNMMGCEIRISSKEVKKKTQNSAYYVIGIFDCKVDSKLIRFFDLGKEDKYLQYTYIAILIEMNLHKDFFA